MTKHPASRVSRRDFLRRIGAISAGGACAPLAASLAGIGSAAAQTSGGYKALVCIFLYGGNDAYNTVLATDAESWDHYLAVRDTIALRAPGTPPLLSAGSGTPDRLGGVLAINPLRAQGRSFALHPVMSGARDLFETGRLAVVANVGPLLRPTTKAQYLDQRFAKPAKLFSHNDQASTWQAGSPEGAIAGWGGRAADLVMDGNRRAIFTSISTSGNAVWLAGESVLQYQVSSRGAIRIGSWGDTLYGSTEALARMRNVMRRARGKHVFEQDYAAVVARSIDAQASLAAALPASDAAPYGTPGVSDPSQDPLLQYDNPRSGGKATNPLAQQLQLVARAIGARGALGMQRQIFFVSLGNFDTHDGQGATQAENLARLSHGLKYFNDTLAAIGAGNDVTTFTASDFGRTFTSNGDGTDHGWGAHHFVMGGAVRGGDIYGRFPTYSRADEHGDFASPNQIGNGTMLPEVSVDQYAATMARWFGVPDAQLPALFPNLANFGAGVRDLGFFG